MPVVPGIAHDQRGMAQSKVGVGQPHARILIRRRERRRGLLRVAEDHHGRVDRDGPTPSRRGEDGASVIRHGVAPAWQAFAQVGDDRGVLRCVEVHRRGEIRGEDGGDPRVRWERQSRRREEGPMIHGDRRRRLPRRRSSQRSDDRRRGGRPSRPRWARWPARRAARGSGGWMRDVGGSAAVDSAPGQGTSVELRWPV